MLISAVQPSNQVYISFSYSFIMVYHRILNIVLCAIQLGLAVSSLIYLIVCIC